ncbi:MAG: hypothetical protein LBQ44_06220 [Treponema sp.]|jgi:chromosome segregation ATPase|nr:hypothetical protein [Treponema sp.]
MDFFTVGNLLTLGICVLAIVLIRYLDRNNRSVDLAREYGKRLKEEIAVFTEERAAAVRDYAVNLGVEKSVALEVLERINITKEDLADKAAAIAEIGERIAVYDKSLEDLVRTTARVQENLSRLKDEAAFVEHTEKLVSALKTRLDDIEKDLGGVELRFERENAFALERTAEALTASVKSAVLDLQAAAETVERRVEDHRQAVDRVEAERKARLAEDIETINNALGGALERAGDRAGKLEEAALVKFREEAQERVRRFQESIEKKLKEYRETSLTQAAEWKRDMEALDALALSQQAQWNAAAEETGERIKALGAELEEKAARAEQRILTETEKRLSEYSGVQAEQWEKFARLADDAGRLDGQLRMAMEDTEERVRRDFALFEEEQKLIREEAAAAFGGDVSALRADMEALEQELNGLKSSAYDNVSEKLKIFEDDFFADLARRDGAIDTRLNEWQSGLEGKLSSLAASAEAGRRGLELSYGEDLKKRLEDLKAETGALEEGIRANMVSMDTALESLQSRLASDLEETKIQAENAAKAEINRYALGMNEVLKTNQRGLEEQLKAIAASAEEWNVRIKETEESARRDMAAWQSRFAAQMRDAEDSIEDARRKTHDLVNETDDRIALVKSGIEEVRRQLSEFTAQTRLFDKADELRTELERRMEDLKGDLSGLDQRRLEAAQLEAQFVKIRRLEDEVNSKMTRFLSEKHRFELMEKDFNRLIQTSQSVEEKLKDVTNSNDVLMSVQVELHKLEEAAKNAEEKFQRLEKKNRLLDETSGEVDRNFKLLEETQTALKRCTGDIEELQDELESFRPAIERLAAADERAKTAADKLARLDDNLKEIENRIESMQTAREWLARAETRFEELSKETQEMVKLKGALQKEKGERKPAGAKGAPPIAARENVIKLARQGWGADEIARTLKLSRGEVELILEMGVKGE